MNHLKRYNESEDISKFRQRDIVCHFESLASGIDAKIQLWR